MSVEAGDNGIPIDIILDKAVGKKLIKRIMIAGDRTKHLPLDTGAAMLRPDLPLMSEAEAPNWRALSDDYVMSELVDARIFTSDSQLEASVASGVEGITLDNELNLTLGNVAGDILETTSTIASLSQDWSAAEIGAVAIVILMVPFILCSNLMVVLSVVRYRRLHTPTNYFITSLAAVDVLVALAVPFVVVIEVFHFGGADGPKDVMLCLLPNRILMMACGVSVLTLATIAYDRHTALVSPLEYVNIMTTKKVAIMVTVTWVYSAFIVWLPLLVGWVDDPSAQSPCSSNLLSGKASVLFLGAIFVPSCIAILVCYSRIFLVARHHAKAIAAVELAIHRNLQVKFMIKDTKYAKTLALVIGVFLVLWFPYLIYIFIQTVSPVKFDIWTQTYLILLAVFNSGINPWIYAFKNNEFRAAFKRMFKDICKDKLCYIKDRRPSLVPAVSTTPRLSRTDSRMLSNLLECTLDIISDQLKTSVNSLSDPARDGRLYDAACARSNTNVPDDEALVSPAPSLKQLVRHTASCCDLDSYVEVGESKGDAHKYSRSLSLDYGLTHQNLIDISSHACSVGEKSKSSNVDNICDIRPSSGEYHQVEAIRTDIVPASIFILDEKLSKLHIVSSLSSSSSSEFHISSSSCHVNITSSVHQNSMSTTNDQCTSVDFNNTSPTSVVPMHASTLPMSPSFHYPQHPHTSSSCHQRHSTCTHTMSAPLHSYYPTLDTVQTTFDTKLLSNETSTITGQILSPTFHYLQDVHQDTHQTLTHIHSCPTLEPEVYHTSHLLPYWEKSLLSSYLGTPETGSNHVSRLAGDGRNSNTKFFI